eukprot:9312779-Pyramimonas_sp.AAC.1
MNWIDSRDRLGSETGRIASESFQIGSKSDRRDRLRLAPADAGETDRIGLAAPAGESNRIASKRSRP